MHITSEIDIVTGTTAGGRTPECQAGGLGGNSLTAILKPGQTGPPPLCLCHPEKGYTCFGQF